jgi:butyrate response factor 1
MFIAISQNSNIIKSENFYNQKQKNQKTKKKKLSKSIMEEEKKKDPKYKTELCKTYSETGECPYGKKCRFAHGKDELFSKDIGINYKKIECKSFSESGFCPYGSRCSFKHDERELKNFKLPFYYVKLFIFNNLKPLKNRLKIFEEITIEKNNKNDNKNNKKRVNSSSTSEISYEEEN